MAQQSNKHLDFAVKLAKKAGKVMNRYFQSDDIGIEHKDDTSPVTVADHAINKMVIDAVKKDYPEHGVIGEEDSYEPTRKNVWVVDPVDGTMPYHVGMPNSTFCLALVEGGEVQVSVVYDPFQDRMATAIKGKGAFLNGKRLHVSKDTVLMNKYVLMFRSSRQPELNSLFDELQKRGAKIISVPSFSYMALLVAEGHFVAACMHYGSPWDAAAISLIVGEAGGTVTDINGKQRTYNEWGGGLIVTNGHIHDEIIDLIQE